MSADLNSSIADLLLEAGISTVNMEVAQIDDGGNNKAFAVHTKSKKYLAKIYYSHPSDTRNRLNAEYSFLKYAKKLALSVCQNQFSPYLKEIWGYMNLFRGGN